MLNFLYNLIIFPIEQIIEICYVFAFRISSSPGLSILAVSIVVSTLILPIYFSAEKQQQAEREKQKQMKKRSDAIKAVLKGDKRYMLLSALYKQHNYHPVYALRNSLDLLIQVPFFIAAYHFIKNLTILNGQSFLFIGDLGNPDKLLFGINFLPVLMTIINIMSGMIYSRGFALKDKIQIYGIAVVFLVLLYNSPSALVLYWTSNNIYNLVKNILQKNKHSKKIIYLSVFILGSIISIYVLFFRTGSFVKRLAIVIIFTVILLIPIWKKLLNALQSKIYIKNTALDFTNRTFILTLFGILLLIGLVIPTDLIISSVAEFSYLGPYSSPFPYIGTTFLQSLGIFLWLFCLFFLFSKNIRIAMTYLMTLILGMFLINAFIFIGDYGYMTSDLRFSQFSPVARNQVLLNIASIFGIFILLTFLLLHKKEKLFLSLQTIIIGALLCFGLINIYQIRNDFNNLSITSSSIHDKVFTFSKTGKNVVVIMLDNAVSAYLPFIFEEKPNLIKSFDGFIFYPNVVSFGHHTVHGAPPIFGGYSYTPLEIQKESNDFWLNKYRQSMQVLPRLFSEAGFKVSVHDQPWINPDIYGQYENISASSIMGSYTSNFTKEHKDLEIINYYKILTSNLIRFSFFRVSPLLVHKEIYDRGLYFTLRDDIYIPESDKNVYSREAISSYTTLYYLSEITEITDERVNFTTIFVNDLAHSPAFYQAPDYSFSSNITNKGSAPFSNERYYHANMASYILLGKWFDYLKMNEIYDNTRIIIVSDHGYNSESLYPYNNILPNGQILQAYACLLLVKDFNSNFDLTTDYYTFMTNADVPHIAASGLIEKLINPFSGEELLIDKDKGVTITASRLTDPDKIYKFPFDRRNEPWFHVHTNIFDLSNWSVVE